MMTKLQIIAAVAVMSDGDPKLKQISSIITGLERKRRVIQPKEAAAILNVCRRSLLRFEREGKLLRIHLSTRKIRYDADDVERLAYGDA